MVWTDGKGVDTFNNIIETLYGNWSKSTNDNTTLTNGTIRWGAIGNMQAGSKTVMRSFGSFNENIGYKNNTLSAESNAYLEKNLNGTVEKGEISIGVTASIFA